MMDNGYLIREFDVEILLQSPTALNIQ